MKISFYTTYKELKHNSHNANVAQLVYGFYTTYKELKQGLKSPFYFVYFSFYTTYKELKLASSLSSPLKNWVFILPIRN